MEGLDLSEKYKNYERDQIGERKTQLIKKINLKIKQEIHRILMSRYFAPEALEDVEMYEIQKKEEDKKQRKTTIKGLNLAQYQKPKPKHRKCGKG